MRKVKLHQIHTLLNNAIYLSMPDGKMPDYMSGVQQALDMIKKEIRDDGFDYYDCEDCEENKPIKPSHDDFNRMTYYICDDCAEKRYQRQIEGEF